MVVRTWGGHDITVRGLPLFLFGSHLSYAQSRYAGNCYYATPGAVFEASGFITPYPCDSDGNWSTSLELTFTAKEAWEGILTQTFFSSTNIGYNFSELKSFEIGDTYKIKPSSYNGRLGVSIILYGIIN